MTINYYIYLSTPDLVWFLSLTIWEFSGPTWHQVAFLHFYISRSFVPGGLFQIWYFLALAWCQNQKYSPFLLTGIKILNPNQGIKSTVLRYLKNKPLTNPKIIQYWKINHGYLGCVFFEIISILGVCQGQSLLFFGT